MLDTLNKVATAIKNWIVRMYGEIRTHGLAAEPLIWTAVAFFSFVSFLTTYFSLRETIFAVPEGAKIVGFFAHTGVFLKHVVMPFMLALALALFILGLKVKFVAAGLHLQRGRVFAAVMTLVLAASISIVFNYDIIFRTAREPFLVAKQQAQAYNLYGSYLKEGRTVLTARLDQIDKAETETVATLAGSQQKKLDSHRDVLTARIEELRKTNREQITALETERDKRLGELTQALATRRLAVAEELGRLRGRLAAEQGGLIGQGLSGQKGYGSKSRTVDATLVQAESSYRAEIDGKEQILVQTREQYAARIVELSAQLGRDIEAARTAAQSVVDTEKTGMTEARRDATTRLKTEKDRQRQKVRDGLAMIEGVEQHLELLGKCDTVACVSDRDNQVATLLLPVGVIVGKPLPRTANLPPMFASIQLTWDVMRGTFPQETVMVVFSWLVAFLIDLADIFALLWAKRAIAVVVPPPAAATPGGP